MNSYLMRAITFQPCYDAKEANNRFKYYLLNAILAYVWFYAFSFILPLVYNLRSICLWQSIIATFAATLYLIRTPIKYVKWFLIPITAGDFIIYFLLANRFVAIAIEAKMDHEQIMLVRICFFTLFGLTAIWRAAVATVLMRQIDQT
ncbi:hypothetical protein [Methylobacterium indicum]|uniref:hypothetical protein n=1 Tax=Methylobacterium indicum TaxID=1775910 RepID=UPI000A776783|nr:hypothetical protein [Methylobacterium indicum]